MPNATVRRRLAAGQCAYCGADNSPTYYCSDCKDSIYKRITANKKRKQNMGICRDCTRPVDGNTTLCARHRRQRKERAKRYKQRCKDNQLCIQCGTPLSEDDIEAGVTSHFWTDCKPYRSNT